LEKHHLILDGNQTLFLSFCRQ